MSKEYFSRKEVSNSDLLALRRAFYVMGDPAIDNAQAFKFGNLVDAMLSTPKLLDWTYRKLWDGEDWIEFSFEDWSLAEILYKEGMKDPVIRAFVESGQGQHIFARILQFTFEEEPYSIPARCKFDSIKQIIKTGADYKTTACASYKSFIASIDHFCYDQQGAWYMDIAETDRHWIIGIGKKTKQIYKFAMQRGDETYLRGRAKYAFWAQRWLLLIENFELDYPTPYITIAELWGLDNIRATEEQMQEAYKRAVKGGLFD